MKKSIAITGGIGSGKTTLLKCIQLMGYPTFSCDAIYREIIDTPTYIQKVGAIFPEAVAEGKINKTTLANIIFNDLEKRERLNALAHPLIMEKLYAYMDECTDEYVFAEVPLLFEGNYENNFDVVIVVERDEGERIKSVAVRDNIGHSEIENRIASQFDYSSVEGKKRVENCNAIIIKNDGSVEGLKKRLKELIQSLSF